MSCPVIKDERVIKALHLAQEMADFMKELKCPKSKEIVSQWITLKKDCPYKKCKNVECPCGDECTCLERCGECHCERKRDAE